MGDKKLFDAVVISGGGTNGILALGSLHYYHERKLYNPEHVKEYAGASVGSIICLLLACGYYPMEIFREIYDMDNFFTAKDCHSFWEIFSKMGIMTTQGLTEKIEGLVKKRLGVLPTLGKLKEMTGKRLCISGANVTKHKGDMYSPETHPNLNAVKAVIISCNLPIIFQGIKYRGEYVVDGGLVNNFPWDFITEGLHILGIVIVVGNDGMFHDNEFIGYLYRVITLPINTLTDLRCQIAPDNVHTIKTSCKGKTILEFSMSHETKMDMFLEGYRSAEEEENIEYITVMGWDFKFRNSQEFDVEEWNKEFEEIDIPWE